MKEEKPEAGSGRDGEGGGVEVGKRKEDRLRLVDRDKQLMAVLATVRYLVVEQLQRLFFAGRTTVVNLEKRLLQLAGIGKHGVPHAYLRKLHYVNKDGRPRVAWTLTELGYRVADSVLPCPAKRPNVDVTPLFMGHALAMSELYVQLLEGPLLRALAEAKEAAKGAARPSREFLRLKGHLYARVAHPGFRWLASDEVLLPWKQYDRTKHKSKDKHIIPDATLELTAQRKRFFLEYESGAQSVTSGNDENTGSTVAKLGRYEEFLYGFAGDPLDGDKSSWYARKYPDQFAPVVLFLVEPGTRQATVTAAIAEWKKGGRRLDARAITVDAAAADFLATLGYELPVARDVAAVDPMRDLGSVDEAKALVACFTGFRADLRERQASNKAKGGEGPYPPEGYAAAKALVERLAGRLAK